MRGVVLLSVLQVSSLFAAGVSVTNAVSVTNHAGRVLSGEFGGVTNSSFVVNGKAYPLSILPKNEILRLKKLAGCDVRTAKEKRLDRARAMRLERIRLREAEGEIDRETADRLRAEALGAVPQAPSKTDQ